MHAHDACISEGEHIFIGNIVADVDRSVAVEAAQEGSNGIRFGGHSAREKIDGRLTRDNTNLRQWERRLLKEISDLAQKDGNAAMNREGVHFVFQPCSAIR